MNQPVQPNESKQFMAARTEYMELTSGLNMSYGKFSGINNAFYSGDVDGIYENLFAGAEMFNDIQARLDRANDLRLTLHKMARAGYIDINNAYERELAFWAAEVRKAEVA